MRRFPPLHAFLFAALLWVAQMQGVVHGISHLGGDQAGMRDIAAAHTLVCPDCAAYAQAGAAPVPVVSGVLLEPPARRLARVFPEARLSSTTAYSYQSRAPPCAIA